ncbi:MAG: LuxR C-terminal-related transcriptional regulator [Muribaculaceae bacterium]|nr:LuxR C-terminal-related transcriptional regulator [Muribaculaceae bacterium]MDE7393044.1 LuxR C-terminal-related transcriptional regulator [Muribaculaceae bacterium]
MAQRFAEAHFLLIIDEPQRAMAISLAPIPNVSIITMASQRNETLQAIDSISKRHHYIHPAVACRAQSTAGVPAATNPVTLLTPTEREILILIARGLSAKEIAAERISSVNTIITHKKNIFRKLQVNTAYEATLIALRSGLADPIEYYI